MAEHARRLSPLHGFVEPLLAGLVLGLFGFALAWPPAGAVGGALLIVLSARVAYDHRGAGRYLLPLMAPFHVPLWCRRHVTGAVIFYVAMLLIVGSLRHLHRL